MGKLEMSMMKDMHKDIKHISRDVNDNKVKTARIEQHLKNLNGSVDSHNDRLISVEKGLNKVQITIAKFGGIMIAIVFAITMAGPFIVAKIAKGWQYLRNI